MARIRLVPATPAHLTAYLRDPAELAVLLSSPLPDGWPEFPESVPYTLDVLSTRPDEASWWMHFFLEDASGLLVGSGGYAGPPVDRCVEIGYEIAPAYRRRGLASAAASALVAAAFASGEVGRVIAHTRPADPRSTGVLRASRFLRAETLADPEEGEVWRWVRERPDSAD